MQKTEIARQYEAKAQPGESPRTRHMALLSAYYFGGQYNFLPRSWDEDVDKNGAPIPFRSRRPSTIIPIPRIAVKVFTRALWGAGRRPKATLADGTPEDNSLIDDVIAEAHLHTRMAEATRRALTTGSGLVVWRLQAGKLRVDVWDAKHADPTFEPGNFPELQSIDYRFQYMREIRDPESGQVKPTKFWHRETIDATTWTIYEDVEVTSSPKPDWKGRKEHPHNLGLVPAVWFTVGERGANDSDGTGIFEPYLALFDDINYTASQQGRSLYYNLDPQTVLSGVNEGDISGVKGGANTWFLPKEAGAKLLESTGSYVQQADKRIDLLKKTAFDAMGIVLPDPERVAGAQSGASLELLAAPQIAEVDSLREDIGDAFTRLLEQILCALACPALAPDKVRVNVRDRNNCQVNPGRVVLAWGAHFPLTPQDAQTAATAANAATAAGALSRAGAARYLARYFGVEDVEADQEAVATDEQRQDQRVSDMEARGRYAGGLDHLPAHLEGEAQALRKDQNP